VVFAIGRSSGRLTVTKFHHKVVGVEGERLHRRSPTDIDQRDGGWHPLLGRAQCLKEGAKSGLGVSSGAFRNVGG
jgi:hypothetical protein